MEWACCEFSEWVDLAHECLGSVPLTCEWLHQANWESMVLTGCNCRAEFTSTDERLSSANKSWSGCPSVGHQWHCTTAARKRWLEANFSFQSLSSMTVTSLLPITNNRPRRTRGWDSSKVVCRRLSWKWGYTFRCSRRERRDEACPDRSDAPRRTASLAAVGSRKLKENACGIDDTRIL